MTFSLAARCARTGMLGVVIASPGIAAGGRCAFARAGLGAVLSQHCTDPRLGRLGLEVLAQGKTAQQTIDSLVVTAAPNHGWRQLAVLDPAGRTAHYSGGNIASSHAAAVRPGAVAIGNRLANRLVPQAEVDAFAEDLRPHLAERLLRGLEAGLDCGGGVEPVRSAALLVVYRESFPAVDLRIDDDAAPIAALRRLWQAWEPQIETFELRALAPDRAGPVRPE
ncbi:MAG: DUF1028 domain-containing protein [Alphaproteobacteria bacterium]|nr:DUF1028 domain-containing protein [Alphaproteobacteria bacterium]MBV9863440.1 DUF1028 domain-containing protein [Alphaproteobacteria bacterium]